MRRVGPRLVRLIGRSGADLWVRLLSYDGRIGWGCPGVKRVGPVEVFGTGGMVGALFDRMFGSVRYG